MNNRAYYNSGRGDADTLSNVDLENLEKSYITPQLAALAKIYRVDRHEGATIMGRSGTGDYSGLVFPYFLPGETAPREYRLRRDNPDLEYKGGQVKETRKYLSPPGRGNRLYFTPGTDPADLKDTSIRVVITEGEKKTLALSRLFSESQRRELPIGLSGVWSWRGIVGKEPGPNGDRQDVKGPIPDLDLIQWRGRSVTILFDANVETEPTVNAARRKLAQELRQRNAIVEYVNIPIDAGVNGVDNLLYVWGPERVLGLLDTRQPSEGDLIRFNRTDAGNAEAFAYLYGDRLRYDRLRKRWLAWQEHRWNPDAGGTPQRLAIDAARELHAQALTLTNIDERKAVSSWAMSSESRNRIDARLTLAQALPPIEDNGANWDKNPLLLGVLNGVIDLSTGELRPGDRDDQITRQISLSYDPGAYCPQWLEFIDQIFKGHTEMIDFIQRAAGYSLTGFTREQVVFICHGKGANGKSTLLNTLCYVLGDYAYNAPFTTFELNQRSAITNDVAALDGRRLIVSSETNEGTRLNEARIKALTGGDTVTARFMHKEFFSFVPCGKFWLAVNHLPRVNDDTDGFWRRVRLIPFEQQFTGENCDRDLESKLKSEAPGILAWAVAGCLEYQSRGLEPPKVITEATEEYRTDSDVLAEFIAERCSVASNAQAGGRELFTAYKEWAELNELSERDRLTETKFGRKMSARFRKDRNRNRKLYHGVGLRAES